MREIWLVRHAESTANAGASTYSPETIPLTARGVQQAHIVADYCKTRPDVIVVSPFLRSRQTAEPLLARYPDVPVQEWNVQEFTYLSPERCHNTTLTDRKPLVAEYWARNDATYCDGGDAESFADFMSRARTAIERIRNNELEFQLIISHGQFIRAVIWLLLHELEEMQAETMTAFHCFLESVSVPNAAIVKIRLPGETGAIYFSNIMASYLPKTLLTV